MCTETFNFDLLMISICRIELPDVERSVATEAQ